MTYDPAPGYYQQQQPARGGSGMAIAALVLGLFAVLTSLTVVGGVLLGLAAVVLGFVALRRIKRGLAGGRVMAIIGIIAGLIGIALSIALVAAGLSLLNSESGQDLQACLREAGTDEAAQAQCQRDFAEDLEN